MFFHGGVALAVVGMVVVVVAATTAGTTPSASAAGDGHYEEHCACVCGGDMNSLGKIAGACKSPFCLQKHRT